MANTKSAQKAARQTKRRTARNILIKDKVRLARRTLTTALKEGDKTAIKEAYSKFSSVADKAAKVNLIHKNKANRLKSRMGLRIKKAAAAAAAPAAPAAK
jgi:small subunit ribosomal protein S20